MKPDDGRKRPFDKTHPNFSNIVGHQKCNVCAEDKPFELFNKSPHTTTGRAYKCKQCLADIKYILHQPTGPRHSILVLKKDQKYCKGCDKVKSRNDFFDSKSKGKQYFCKKCQQTITSAHARKYSEKLTDFYVKNLLVNEGWKRSSILPSLIELKRSSLKLFRKLNAYHIY